MSRTEYTTVKTSLTLISLSLASSAVVAQESELPTRAEIAAKLRGVEAADLRDSVLDGFYEVRLASRVAYISTDGRYLFEGELYDLADSRNLTENARAAARVGLLAGVEPSQMIVFSPKDRPVEHTITIFTDIDCGYCRQFHREIDQVTALGIEVHYLFFPRTGPATDSWSKAEKVWCAEDRNTALTNAKLGGRVPDLSCAETPVAAHYDLGHQVGVTGTPSVYTAGGTHIGGYLPPDTLLDTLNQLAD
jgi:thiol:disulfide interchange protein DsbC